MQSLSQAQARRLFLHAQGLWAKDYDTGAAGTLQAIKHLGYIQIDTISVVARAHHHTLYTRHKNYAPTHLDTLLSQNKSIYEYWSHAAAYLPMRDYRYSLPRKQLYADGKSHWGNGPKPTQLVYDRIVAEGALRSADFEDDGRKPGWWEWKESKRALEQLFMSGRLMVAGRRGFQKVYDLTERILPSGIDTSMPTPSEQARYLIAHTLRTSGLATVSQIAYLRQQATKTIVKEALAEMVEAGELATITIANVPKEIYYSQPDTLAAIGGIRVKKRFHILSPFDNSVIQRKRLAQWFGYDYMIECYVPAPKRIYGYFSLPLLYGDTFVGRMDAKADSATQAFIIRNVWWEEAVILSEELLAAFAAALTDFRTFNTCERIDVADKKLKHVMGPII
jgi:uncharacterized protein